jgi:hypothetical protein
MNELSWECFQSQNSIVSSMKFYNSSDGLMIRLCYDDHTVKVYITQEEMNNLSDKTV